MSGWSVTPRSASSRAHNQPERLQEMIGNLPFSTILVVPELNGCRRSIRGARPVGHPVAGRGCGRQRDADAEARLRYRHVGVAAASVTPLLLLIATGIKLDSRGPLLFRQARWAGGTRSFRAQSSA